MGLDLLQAARTDSGARLHLIRAEKGLTLTEVSARTGVPASTLSKIENGKMPLTRDKLVRISAGLDLDAAALVASRAQDPVRTARRSISRAGEGQSIETDRCSERYPAADLLNKQFVPRVAELRARSIEEFGAMIRHPGEEYAFVLEGAVEFHTETYAPVVLNAGDSIYFDGGMAHAYLAAAPGPCRVLAICSGI
jgi:transcriptional regulator with XRE-family HTH domain